MVLLVEAESLYMYSLHPFNSHVCFACDLFMTCHVYGTQGFGRIIATACNTCMHCMSNKDLFNK